MRLDGNLELFTVYLQLEPLQSTFRVNITDICLVPNKTGHPLEALQDSRIARLTSLQEPERSRLVVP